MSLSRILNDEPSPALLSYAAPRPFHLDSPASSSRVSPPGSHPQHHHPPEPFLPPQQYSQKSFQPPAPYPHAPDWPQNDIRAPDGDKRHDVEYGAPPQQRRFPSYKSASSDAPPAVLEPKRVSQHYRSLNEESQLTSSDLEDCEDVWIEELSDYILETQKRQNEVEKWFEASVLERNSTVAQSMSHHYAAKMASMPSAHIEDDSRAISPESEYDYGMDNGGYEPPEPPRRFGDGLHEFEGYTSSVRDLPPVPPAAYPALRNKGKGKEVPPKRGASGAVSDASSDATPVSKKGRPAKKRKVDANLVDEPPAMDTDGAEGPEWISTPPLFMPAQKPQAGARPVVAPNGLSAPKPPRKKPGPKKKAFGSEIELELASQAPSIASDITPALSRPPSPTLTSTFYFELDDPIPPLKKAKKVDDGVMIKRLKTLEESQRKVWTNIARREVAKVYKYHVLGFHAKVNQAERLAKIVSVQARRPFSKTNKTTKDTQTKGKRLMREMQVFWKKNEREERDVRKREHKEAMDRLKLEEEKREAARQARKLEFLISQTELYSHFVGSKLKTAEMEGEGDAPAAPAGADVGDLDPAALRDINFDEDDQTNLHMHARHNAQEAISLAKQRAQEFDAQAALERKTNEALKLAKAQAHIHDTKDEPMDSATDTPLVDLDSDELNFQNPTSLSGPLTIGQPKMLMAQLKEYQLKGLNWLATLYEQGINGILADEMGLGKTVQSISLLSYLAETHDIWGPFLVVAPASTLHNWQQEITRFVPGLKALPYWGNVKDRATLRKFWSKKEITYNKDAPFHILITSYQLVTQDQQYFQRVNWQYMILDEAQNIKNSSSVRWKTLLGFHCRNRLLLTGTPIQNSMQELWALLHFIMPSLFDSHDEFNEWFSKDIENAAENKGSKLNEHQLRRLHMILKPFMLRRVKRHVQNELSEKIEKDIYVDLSARQRSLYKALLANVSVADLLEKAANIGDVDSARSLMNLVMQFRKVCNHPELFERADVVAPFSFARFGRTGSLMREGDFVSLQYSTRNPIEMTIPELLYQDGGILSVPSENSTSVSQSSCLTKLFNIWSTDWIHRSLYDEDSSSFSFLRLLGSSAKEAHDLHLSPVITRRLSAVHEEASADEGAPYYSDPMFAAYSSRSSLQIPGPSAHLRCLDVAAGLPDVRSISKFAWKESCLSRPELKWFVPPAVAPVIALHCNDRTFLESQAQLLDGPLETLALYGLSPELRESEEACDRYRSLMSGLAPVGLIGSSAPDQLPSSTMQVPEAKRLIYDSAKLARLDTLLQELKAGDHRVLVYFQMTRMMDLMEEYLIYRQYKYLRLDGSSKLEDRRDMVIDWQTRPDIFVFLLSTRAGGLGINLTAADTVVFYDHDWNPSNDAQAMDRAHRLGQTRQVTVYRLITRGTIDERIVQMARVKKDVQDIVVGTKNFTEVAKPSEIMQLLLNDEQLATLDTTAAQGPAIKPSGDAPARDLWNEEDDNDISFFGHSGPTAALAQVADPVEDENGGPAPTATRGKKRKNATGAPRGRKPGRKKAGTEESAPL
ncbi:SNF2 family N-terminal domain-containing protein [Mycena rosella]|uniref:Chromatin-remodeling ATPase INO80 n=1 Tax=Mycena rosella TaxID=1033263 RepID=A0AAD7GV27_MYCRO|nr:SNF2 family N-terminal domain-containing protein [Mycena rosella]